MPAGPPLSLIRMHNDASVQDWIGTAKTAAILGARQLDAIYDEPNADNDVIRARFVEARNYLVQALDEMREVGEILSLAGIL